MSLDKIKKYIDLMQEKGVAELSVKSKDDEINIKMAGGSVAQTGLPAAQQQVFIPPPPPANSHAGDGATASEPTLQPGQKFVYSPFVGTYYEASSPGADPFVQEGQTIQKGQVLCIIEAMKLMNEIEAESGGKILQVLVKNEQPVEFEQPLFIVQG